MSILIKNGRIVDPAGKIDKEMDLFISGNKIVKTGKQLREQSKTEIDATGMIVAPGFVDMHTHLREPGREDKETIETGARAAVAGGFTTICAMPNTEPPCDTAAQAKYIIEKAEKVRLARVLPIGTITKGRKNKELTEMQELIEAGCPAFSDDGTSVETTSLMRRALEYAAMLDTILISHCEDKDLAADGTMNEGYWSTVLGMKPIPREAEAVIVDRDIRLAESAGARLHIAHVSTAESVHIIREAKKRGVRITSEVTPHHFSLTDENVKTYDANYKVNPPLRTEEDIKAMKEGIKDGTIDAIATDHAPHREHEKEKEFDFAPFGMIGLETALSLTVKHLINEGVVDWIDAVRLLSTSPAQILRQQGGTLAEGAVADIVIINPSKKWIYDKKSIRSKSFNSPFVGQEMVARATDVIVGGRVVMRSEEIL